MSKQNVNIAGIKSSDDLSTEELKLIEMARNDNYQSLKIVKRNGRIDIIESTERIVQRKRIIDILNEHNYQNIEIKRAEGRVVAINRTVKTKL